jgi:type IV pilus assembly protein PilP
VLSVIAGETPHHFDTHHKIRNGELFMAKKKAKSNAFRNTVVVLLVLVLAQVAFLCFSYSTDNVMQISDAIEDSVKGISDPVERERQKLRLAVMQFQVKYRKLPEAFDDLVPDFLKAVPRNPKTGQAFEMVIRGEQFELAVDMEEARLIRASMQGMIAGSELSDEELIDVSGIHSDYVYNPSGKRDPFLHYGFFGQANPEDCDNPITCVSLTKLKLALVIDTGTGKRAMVETPDGRGYTVLVGSKIGAKGGEIVEIQDDKLLILEQKEDLAGNITNTTHELKLRADKKK